MEESQADQMGSLEEATRNAAQLLEVNPNLAAEQAEAILEAVPNHPPAMFLLASRIAAVGTIAAALEFLEPLLNAQHNGRRRISSMARRSAMLAAAMRRFKALLKQCSISPSILKRGAISRII